MPAAWLGTALPLPPVGEHALLVFWCQLVVLLLGARAGGYLFRRLGQPRVIGELLAGVVIGPSVAGRLWADGWDWLFPVDPGQSGLLLGLAWFGIVLMLMLTGAEIDLALVRRQGRAAASISLGSLVVPLGVGALLGVMLPDQFIGADGRRWVFVMFIAIALAISSLPVAARILADLGLLSRPVGQLVMAAAVGNDVVGWLLLGLLAGLAETGRVSITGLLVAVAGTATIAVVVIAAGPWVLDRGVAAARARDAGPTALASIAVLFTVTVGAATHAIGIEVVIGAFLAGMAIARSRFGNDPIMGHVETMTYAVFAPLFFAVAGLRVDLGAIDRNVIVGAIAVTLVATLAKLVGAYAGARIGGIERRDAFGVGAALNARGALEIVIATVGLSLGVLNDTSYAAIVVMAIVTTALAGPLLRIASPRFGVTGPDPEPSLPA